MRFEGREGGRLLSTIQKVRRATSDLMMVSSEASVGTRYVSSLCRRRYPATETGCQSLVVYVEELMVPYF